MSAFIVYGCDPVESGTGPLVVSDKTELTQTLYADSEIGSSKIIFYAAGPWTSWISEVTRAEESDAEWISISPSEGKMEGDYNVVISVAPNFTGNDRTAKITIICGETGEITVEVTQKSEKKDGTQMISFEELVEQSEELFRDAEADFIKIDGLYPTLTSRQAVNASTAVLYDFWEKSYAAIDCLNALIEWAEADISAQEMDVIEYTAAAYRAVVYFYLNTLFGGVPLTTNTETKATETARTPSDDVSEFIYSELDGAIAMLPAAEVAGFGLFKVKLAMSQPEYQKAVNAAEYIIDSGTISFADTNGDGMLNAEDSDALQAAQIYLMAAEASLQLGKVNDAAGFVNVIYMSLGQLPALSEGSTEAQVRTAIQNTCANWNKGMKFANNIRWDSTDWGRYALLPIPEKAMEANDKLTQNTGW